MVLGPWGRCWRDGLRNRKAIEWCWLGPWVPGLGLGIEWRRGARRHQDPNLAGDPGCKSGGLDLAWNWLGTCLELAWNRLRTGLGTGVIGRMAAECIHQRLRSCRQLPCRKPSCAACLPLGISNAWLSRGCCDCGCHQPLRVRDGVAGESALPPELGRTAIIAKARSAVAVPQTLLGRAWSKKRP
jgi:hypothetical protein